MGLILIVLLWCFGYICSGEEVVVKLKDWGWVCYVFGGLIFGFGWGLVGVCLGFIFVLIGVGVWLMFIILLFVLFGIYFYGLL